MSKYPDKCDICNQTLYYFKHEGVHPRGLKECIQALAERIEECKCPGK